MSEIDKILPHIMDLKEAVGGLSAEVRATNAHLASVSRKADGIGDELKDHKSNLKAHGREAVEADQEYTKSRWERWAALGGLAGAIAALVAQFWPRGAH